MNGFNPELYFNSCIASAKRELTRAEKAYRTFCRESAKPGRNFAGNGDDLLSAVCNAKKSLKVHEDRLSNYMRKKK